MAKTYRITFGDSEEIVEQDSPLRAIEELVSDVTEVTIGETTYSVELIEQE